jgi:hypothetical protein
MYISISDSKKAYIVVKVGAPLKNVILILLIQIW